MKFFIAEIHPQSESDSKSQIHFFIVLIPQLTDVNRGSDKSILEMEPGPISDFHFHLKCYKNMLNNNPVNAANNGSPVTECSPPGERIEVTLLRRAGRKKEDSFFIRLLRYNPAAAGSLSHRVTVNPANNGSDDNH